MLKYLSLIAIMGVTVPAFAQERAQTTARFIDSIGVDVHMTYTDTAYGTPSLVTAKLQKLGVKHVRDGVNAGTYTPNTAQQAVCSLGIDFLMNAGAAPYSSTVLANYGTAYTLPNGSTCINGYEGNNEQDTNPEIIKWYSHWNSDYSSLVSALPTGVPAVGPPLANIGNRTAVTAVTVGSYGNMHPYPAGQIPSAIFPSQSTAASLLFPGLPLQASETGYHTAVNDHRDQPAIDYATGAKYIPRLLAESFNNGVYRTYLYELLDEMSSSNTTLQNQKDSSGNAIPNSNEQSSWGLVAADGTEKPAFKALANLITILRTGASTVASPSVMPFALTTTSSNIHHTLLQKSANVYDLLLWQDVSSWNQAAQTDTSNPAISASLLLRAGSATVYTPSASTSGVTYSATNSVVTIPVPDEVIVVEFTATAVPQGAGGNIVANSVNN